MQHELVFIGKKHLPITYEIMENKCWICTSHKLMKKIQRVRVTVDGNLDYLYRHVYRHFKSDIPKGLVVRHLCNNSLCINPDHLAIGTQQDNVNDMVKSDRQLKGEKNPRNIYNENQVKKVYELLCENRLLISEISKVTGVNSATIVAIKNGKEWSWLFDIEKIKYTQSNRTYNEIKRKEIKEDIKSGMKQREIVEKHKVGRGLVAKLAKELKEDK